MKNFCLFSMFAMLTFTTGSEYLMACHEEAGGGDMGILPTLRGHSPKSRQSGIFVTLEGTSAGISTSTNCDAYTSFLELNYDQIAENISRGQGSYIDALASLRGCSKESKLLFRQVLHENFSELYEYQELNGADLGRRLDIVLNHEPALKNDCILIPDSSHA